MSHFNPLDRLKARQTDKAPKPAPKPPLKPQPELKALEGLRLRAEKDFAEAQNRLQVLEDIDQKLKVKREYLPKLSEYVRYYLASGARYPNAVAVHAAIWSLDVGDIENGLDWGLALIEQGQQAPARFQSSLETMICRGIYEWSAAKLKADASASPYLEQLVSALDLGKWDLPEMVGSMMYAMQAKHAKRIGDWQAVYDACAQAKKINPEKHGVKTLFEQAARQLGKAA